MRPGDRITAVMRLAGYREREGRLGLMLFTSSESTWTNQDDEMVKRFLQSGRPGFYVAIVREGDVARGDLIAFTSRATAGMTVEDDFRRRSIE